MKPLFAALLLIALAMSGTDAFAQADAIEPVPDETNKIEADSVTDEAEPVMVMDHEVEPMVGMFEVTTDVNVRSGPGTTFERVDGLEEGARVRAIGRAKDPEWVAVSQEGKIVGFVYAPILVPVVDGSLEEQFFGSYMSPDDEIGVACEYRFRFDGKTEVEGAGFESSDYEIRFRCAGPKGTRLFYALMYLTEAPIEKSSGDHLIGLDVRSIGDGMVEFLTTRYHYNPKSGKLTFEGHSLPRFATPPKVQEFETENIQDALTQALEASIASWTPKAWDKLLIPAE